MPIRLGSSCPQCGAIFGVEEADWNKCFSCGYPDVIEGEEEEDDVEN